MANVVRANRELEDRARFGLGTDDQDDDATEIPLTAEGVSRAEGEAVLGNGPEGYVNSYSYDTDAEFGGVSDPVIFIRKDTTKEAQYSFGAEDSADYYGAIMTELRYERTDPYTAAGFSPEVAGGWFEAHDFSQTTTGPFTSGIQALGANHAGSPGGFTYAANLSSRIDGDVGDANQGGLFGINMNTTVNNQYAGTITAIYGIRNALNAGAGGGWTATNAYGVYLDYNLGAGNTVTNLYGLYVEDFTRAGTTLNYNIISKGANSGNLFEGYVLAKGGFDSEVTVATNGALRALVTGDANYRLFLDNNGKMAWGDGTAALDTFLRRTGAGVLATDGLFVVTQGLYADGALNLRVPGAAQVIFVEQADPTAPPANQGILYMKDVGGKTALMVQFPTGTPIQVAVEA